MALLGGWMGLLRPSSYPLDLEDESSQIIWKTGPVPIAGFPAKNTAATCFEPEDAAIAIPSVPGRRQRPNEL
jgi:hypothetical protein